MEPELLKRRLNPFLLVSTVLVLSLLAGLSVLYQGQLSEILSEKKSLQSQMEEKNARIAELENRTANLSRRLNTKQTDLKQTVDLYQSEKQKRKRLQDEVSSLESEISSLKTDIEGFKSEISDLEAKIDDLNSTVDDLNQSLSDICSENDNNLTDTSDECQEHGHEYEGK